MTIRSDRMPRAIEAERGQDGNVNAVPAKRHREELLEIVQVEGHGVATMSSELS